MLFAMGIAAVIAAQSPTPPATSPAMGASPVGEIKNPIWRERPSQQRLSTLYPFPAMASETIGAAVVSCTARSDGSLASCQLVCESPVGWGFGKAVLSVAPSFAIQPTLPDGRSVEGGTVKIYMPFHLQATTRVERCDRQGFR